MQSRVSFEINRIHFDDVTVKDIEEMDALLVAKQVEARMLEIEKETQIADTVKLAMLTAISFASELLVYKNSIDSKNKDVNIQLDDMINRLDNQLNKRRSA